MKAFAIFINMVAGYLNAAGLGALALDVFPIITIAQTKQRRLLCWSLVPLASVSGNLLRRIEALSRCFSTSFR